MLCCVVCCLFALLLLCGVIRLCFVFNVVALVCFALIYENVCVAVCFCWFLSVCLARVIVMACVFVSVLFVCLFVCVCSLVCVCVYVFGFVLFVFVLYYVVLRCLMWLHWCLLSVCPSYAFCCFLCVGLLCVVFVRCFCVCV